MNSENIQWSNYIIIQHFLSGQPLEDKKQKLSG